MPNCGLRISFSKVALDARSVIRIAADFDALAAVDFDYSNVCARR
jgi:hypothetical protein